MSLGKIPSSWRRPAYQAALAWESATVAGGDPPLAFPPIKLEGAREVVLEADMAGELNQGDRANWLRMMMIR